MITIKNNLKYLKEGSFSTILNDIHSEMINKMKKNQEDQKAKTIENILREIKKIIIKMRTLQTDSAVVTSLNQELVDLIENTFNEQLEVHSKLKQKTALFNRSHNKVSSIKGTDDIFEEQLSYLIKAAAKMKGINIDAGTIIIGQSLITTASINKITGKIEQTILDITNKALENQAKKINSIKISPVVKIAARTGKADIYTPVLNIEEDGTSLINQFLQAISGMSFSLKNYSSYQKDTGNGTEKRIEDIYIHLGKSNPYKSITGALSQIFSDPRAQKRIYFRGMTILAGESKQPDSATESQVYQHFGHLQFIYELRGSGLINALGENMAVDFIIWNDPNSQKIAVRSTASLITEYWEQYAAAFSPISISAIKLLN